MSRGYIVEANTAGTFNAPNVWKVGGAEADVSTLAEARLALRAIVQEGIDAALDYLETLDDLRAADIGAYYS